MDRRSRNSLVGYSVYSPKTRGLNRSVSNRRSGLKPSTVHIVLKSPHHTAERFSMPVPVQVEEAFSFHEKNALITAKLSECGYAWVVSGKSVFVWQFQDTNLYTTAEPSSFPICYELKLPQSDLAHKAELVTVFLNKSLTTHHASCVGVSPEGIVRYWPDVTHGHYSVDQRVDLNGEECDSIIEVAHFGCIVVTTSCTIVSIKYKQGKYGHQIQCRSLKTPGSWLGGIGKKVSSIFFGPISSDQGTETRIIRLLAVPGIQQTYHIYILAGLNLQKWDLLGPEEENLVWSSDLSMTLKEAFRVHISHWETCVCTDIDTWILDIQPDHNGVLMLCCAVNLHMGPQAYYALVSIPTNSQEPPRHPKDFLLLKIMGLYKDNTPGDTLNYKFILCGNDAYVYTTKTITIIKPQEEPDSLDFLHSSDRILSGCTCLHLPIFFSRHYGLVVITSNETDLGATFSASSILLDTSTHLGSGTENNTNLSLYHLDPYELYNAHHEIDGQLKAAFIFHCKNKLTECYDLVNQLFPANAPVLPAVDGPLDTVIVKIGKSILNDSPAGDPRWTQTHSTSFALGSSHSMLVLHQLKDKQQAFMLYLKFLQESGLWEKLTAITVRDFHMYTIHYIQEFAEKITAALAIKNLPCSLVLEDTIEKAVQNFDGHKNKALSNQDVFFREVSRIHEAFLWLAKVCEEASHASLEPENVVRTIHEGNQIAITVLKEILQYRQQTADTYILNDVAKSMHLEYMPWTTAGGPEGIVDALMLQHSLTINYGLKMTANKGMMNSLLEEFVLLTDFILDGRKTHLATVVPKRERVLHKQYSLDRNKLIKPLIELKAYESAAMLAEKYLDFETLVTICDHNNDETRLDEYMRRFSHTGFSEFVYHWYIKEGKQATMLNRYRRLGENLPEGPERLGRFLSAYPSLYWLQQLIDKDFDSAADTLRELAESETMLVTRQKTMYSLSKLAKLADPHASDRKIHLKEVTKRLRLIAFQEQLPDYVLQQYGHDINNIKVFSPRDIISMFTCSEYVDATQMDFQKALAVVTFVDDEEERVDLILQIWRSALLRDSWIFPDLDDPLRRLEETMFFKLADIALAFGHDPSTLLPPIDMLLDDPSLNKLNENITFQALLRVGYEEFHRNQLL